MRIASVCSVTLSLLLVTVAQQRSATAGAHAPNGEQHRVFAGVTESIQRLRIVKTQSTPNQQAVIPPSSCERLMGRSLSWWLSSAPTAGELDLLARCLHDREDLVAVGLALTRALRIEERSSREVTILILRGELTFTGAHVSLTNKIERLISRGRTQIVLNLRQIAYIDANGLGELVRSLTMVKRHGGDVRLSNVPKRLTDLLQLTRLSNVFHTYNSEEDAIRSFSAEASFQVPR